MGKWTPDYVDDVLHAKISSLVSGAINRAAVEKEPTITYQNFVNELDTGDSFTTSLIDILVRELAERSTRANSSDKRLIADCTAKSLRMLATPLRIYRDRASRAHSSRRNPTLTEYLHPAPLEVDMEDEEEDFDGMPDNGTSVVEGVRMNSDLYDAFGWSEPSRRLGASASPSPNADSPVPMSRSRSPPSSARNIPWVILPGAPGSLSSSPLVRQPSLRRPTRTRTVDFNDFTHRRRSSIRDSNSSRPEASESASEPPEGSWNAGTQSARRFFPFTRSRRRESSNFPWSEAAEAVNGEPSEGGAQDYDADLSSRFNSTMPVGSTPFHTTPDTEISEERAGGTTLRLRRGGVRAPESMLSRHASPIAPIPLVDNYSDRESPVDIGNRSPPGELTAYPTPGSSETENAN